MQEWRYNYCRYSCQTCTVKSFNHGLSDWTSKVTYGGHIHPHFLCANIYVRGLWRVSGREMLLCCFFSLNCAHIPLMICAGATNSNAVITRDPTDWAAYATVECWQIWPSFTRVFHQFPCNDLPRRCHICGKIAANVTRQLKSLCWIGPRDSLYNPKGQVLPWQQLALSWAGKAYKQMITRVKKPMSVPNMSVKSTQGILTPLLFWENEKVLTQRLKRALETQGGYHTVGRKWPWIYQETTYSTELWTNSAGWSHCSISWW